MPRRFYNAWALAVILAVALPIAIPYFIWPTDPGHTPSQASESEHFANYARSQVFLTQLIPNSVTVTGTRFEQGARHCAVPPVRGTQVAYNATVKLHGAYGISFSTVHVGCDGATSMGGFGLLSGFAWLLGIVAVSLPFISFRESRLAERYNRPAFPNWPFRE